LEGKEEDFERANLSASAQLGQNCIQTQIMLLWETLSVNQTLLQSLKKTRGSSWDKELTVTVYFYVSIS